MKKYLPLVLLPLLLTGCNETSASEEKVDVIKQKFEAIITSIDKLSNDSNTISYSMTQLNNYSAISISSTRNGNGVMYKDGFYHETFTESIEDNDEYNGIIEKGTVTYKDADYLYSTTFYKEGDTDNSTTLYLKGTTKNEEFMQVDFKSYYLNNFAGYAQSNYLSNVDNGYYTYKLESNIDQLDLSVDGKHELNFDYKIINGSTIVNELKSTDFVTIKNGKVTHSASVYSMEISNGVNFTKVNRQADYLYDESIDTYTGDKLNPLDYYKEN